MAAGLDGRFPLRQSERVAVRGTSDPVALFERLDGERPAGRKKKRETPGRVAAARVDFRARRYAAAETSFRCGLAGGEADGAAALYITRCAWLAEHDPGEEWDGVARMSVE